MTKFYTSLLLGVLLLVGSAGNALAWSAAACTDITNRASLTFSVGGVPQGTLESSPTGNSTLGVGAGADTLVRVDSRVDLDVTTIATPVNATGANQVLRFRITNLGNDIQQYQLQLFRGADGVDDIFNMNNVRVYVDANNDEVYDAGDTLLATNIGSGGPAFGANLGLTGDVLGAVGANDNTLAIFVVSDVPAGQPSGNTAAYALRAISYQSVAAGGGISITSSVATGGVEANNSCGNPVVIGDALETNTAVGGVTDAARDGAAFDSGVYTVVAAGVSVTKTQTVLWDPFNGAAPNAQAIPGAYVQYAITISNAVGAATATLTQIQDALVAQLAIDPDLVTSAGPGNPENGAGLGFKVVHTAVGRSTAATRYFTTIASADGVDFAAGTVTANFALVLPDETPGTTYTAGELRGGQSVTLTFNAIIQ